MNDAPISVQPFLPNTSKKRRVHHSFPSPQGSKSLVQLKHFGNRELGQSQECGESSSREQKNCQGSIYSSGFRAIYFITFFFFFLDWQEHGVLSSSAKRALVTNSPRTGSCRPLVNVAVPGHKREAGVYDPTDRSAHVREPD